MQVNKTFYETNQILHTHSSHTVTTTYIAKTALNSKHAFTHLMTHTFYICMYIYNVFFLYIYTHIYMVILVIISELNRYAHPQI